MSQRSRARYYAMNPDASRDYKARQSAEKFRLAEWALKAQHDSDPALRTSARRYLREFFPKWLEAERT